MINWPRCACGKKSTHRIIRLKDRTSVYYCETCLPEKWKGKDPKYKNKYFVDMYGRYSPW